MFRTKPGEERALIEDWISRPALRKLVEAFGGVWPTGTLETVVADLADFSEIWDSRAGKQDRHMFHDERQESDPHADLTYQAAEELGMMNPPRPSVSSCDYLVILGGLATGVEPRVRYAAQLVDGGLVVERQIAALGSFRRLQERELSVSARFAPEGKYEIDHLTGMMETLFETPGYWSISATGDQAKDPNRASVVLVQPRSPSPSLGAYAASSSDPENRPANTADTFVFWAESNHLEPGQSLLVVTSGIYLPYQHLDAVRTLRRFAVEIETVGLRPATKGPTHTPSAYRQEVRSTLRSARLSVSRS